MTLKIYLAGPDVFLENALDIGREKCRLSENYGFHGLFPIDQEEEVGADPAAIFRANCALMDRADLGFFNLTPFRGPSADVGTVFELGYMFARGKPAFGYSSAVAGYRERVAPLFGPLDWRQERPWDRDGYGVENFGLSDNLMIARALADSGGEFLALPETEGEPLAALKAFEACLAEAARRRDAAKTGGEARALLSGA